MSALAMILVAGMLRDAAFLVTNGKATQGQVIPEDSKWVEDGGSVWEFGKRGKLQTWDADGSKDFPSRYELNTKANPPQIDIITIDGIGLGIYCFRGDHLEIYWSCPGVERPTKFVDGKDKDEDGLVLERLKRVK
jgi:uncharacterized protein (TIGR03067 family)